MVLKRKYPDMAKIFGCPVWIGNKTRKHLRCFEADHPLGVQKAKEEPKDPGNKQNSSYGVLCPEPADAAGLECRGRIRKIHG